MAAEADAEEVEDFALVEVCRGPDGSDAVDDAIFAIEPDDEAHALLQRMRKDVIGDLEARLGGVPVDRGDVFEEVVAGLLARPAGGDDVLAGDGDGQLVAVEFGVGGERRRAP